jgi:hypothetical protein
MQRVESRVYLSICYRLLSFERETTSDVLPGVLWGVCFSTQRWRSDAGLLWITRHFCINFCAMFYVLLHTTVLLPSL